MNLLVPKRDLLVPAGTETKVKRAKAQAVQNLLAPTSRRELDIPPLVDLPWQPDRWLMVVSQVKVLSSHGFVLPDEAIDDQLWTSGIGRVMALGPAVYKGRQFAEKGLGPEHAPKVGDFVIFNAKSPLRQKYQAPGAPAPRVYITINDDATIGRVDPERVEHALDSISFTF